MYNPLLGLLLFTLSIYALSNHSVHEWNKFFKDQAENSDTTLETKLARAVFLFLHITPLQLFLVRISRHPVLSRNAWFHQFMHNIGWR